MSKSHPKKVHGNSNFPAYPMVDANGLPFDTSLADATTGLTKRELIAAMAMQGIVGSISSEGEYQRLKALAAAMDLSVSQWISHDAVKQADALLAELERTA